MIKKLKSIISRKNVLWYSFIFSALLCFSCAEAPIKYRVGWMVWPSMVAQGHGKCMPEKQAVEWAKYGNKKYGQPYGEISIVHWVEKCNCD